MYASHILLICAAPGDDLVGAATAISRAKEQGLEVTAIMLTNGIAPAPSWQFWKKNANKKRAEKIMTVGRQAASALGHEFKAWNLKHASGSLWQSLPQLEAYLRKVIAKSEPQAIWVPAFTGQSPDHDAVNLVVSKVRGNTDVFEFAAIPVTPDGKRYDMVLPQRQGLLLPLNINDAESNRRRRLIELMQRAGATNLILHDAFREVFRPILKHDYANPPYGYVAGPVNKPTSSARRAGAQLLKKVRARFVQYMQGSLPAAESQ